MRIQSTRPNALPKLPEVPAKGKGELVTEPIDFIAPETIQTRLGSIPRDYETGIGTRRGTRSILFENGAKEAANPRGGRTDIWRAQPVFDGDGKVKMSAVSEPLTVKYRNPAAEALGKGLMGAGLVGFFGLWAGMVGSILSGRPEPAVIGALGGAMVGGLAVGVSTFKDASSEQVRLEWQKTDIVERELTGYTHRVDEDEDCTGTGDDRRCDSDYEHIYAPIIEGTKHGEYYRPVVVRFREDS